LGKRLQKDHRQAKISSIKTANLMWWSKIEQGAGALGHHQKVGNFVSPFGVRRARCALKSLAKALPAFYAACRPDITFTKLCKGALPHVIPMAGSYAITKLSGALLQSFPNILLQMK
jgi:hypothetical protein